VVQQRAGSDDGIVTLIAAISTPSCRFEVLEGVWPRPVELSLATAKPILAKMKFLSARKIEACGLDGSWQSSQPIGKTFMILPDYDFIGRGTGGWMRIIRCVFEPAAYAEILSLAGPTISAGQIARGLDISSETINYLLERMAQEATCPGMGSDLLAESVSQTLMVEYVKYIGMKSNGVTQRCAPSIRLVRRVRDFLVDHPHGMPTISDLAAACGTSGRSLSAIFRKATGETIGRYVARHRIAEAKVLLRTTGLPLKRIAHQVGFSDAANFSNGFSRAVGVTPLEYRNRRGNIGILRPEQDGILNRLHGRWR
jgi:AraC family transcriptional regulator